ncbi:AhpD-like protein [Clohesyomyces aquaticus]|uniref:AhpD-like protein n=1 Tax=Clohesyomyces aquaticus TaxID=1231657 RepID=A0A1Y1ZWC5_9PLEO|nr:AhpD-like protein [Clohesyomyces aquaticus]
MSSSIFKATVSLYALSCGHLTLPEYQFVHPVEQTARKTVPSLSFLIQHRNPNNGIHTNIVFDLGLRRDIKRYAEPIQKHVATRQPLSTDPDAVKSLAKGGLNPDDIDYVIYSHVHWDHIGEPRDFAKSTFVIGHGALALLKGTSSSLRGGHSFFEHDLLPEGRTVELPDPIANTTSASSVLDQRPGSLNFEQAWQPYGTLPETLDLFNDGSVFVVNAPGHLPGHINILARVSNDRQVYLGGDACHDRRILTGEKEIGEWNDADGHICCIHVDRKTAEETIMRIRELENRGVEIIFAHDVEWETNSANAVWPPIRSLSTTILPNMAQTPNTESLKSRFEKEIGAQNFDAQWQRLLAHSPSMFAATISLTSVPKRAAHLSPKIQALVSLSVSSASTHLHVPNIHRYTRAALSAGASKAEIVETLQLTSTLGIHACNIGVPILFEVLREEGREMGKGMDGLGEREWALRKDFETRRGYWHGFWEDFLRLSPDFFEAYTEFSGVPWGEGGVRELIYCAFDAAATHLYKPGLKLHMKNVLGYGGTPEEIMEVLELATLLSTSTMDVGLEVLEKELEGQVK